MPDQPDTLAVVPAADTPAIPGRIALDFPFERNGETITHVTIRKPRAGELRGLTMSALMQSDYAALETLLPRITIPPLNKAEVAALDPADIVQLAGEVMDFLLPKAAKPDSPNA